MGADLFLSMIDALSCKLRQGAPNPAYCATAVACASAIPSTIPPSGFGCGRTNRRIQEGRGSSGGRMRRGGHENGGEKGAGATRKGRRGTRKEHEGKSGAHKEKGTLTAHERSSLH